MLTPSCRVPSGRFVAQKRAGGCHVTPSLPITRGLPRSPSLSSRSPMEPPGKASWPKLSSFQGWPDSLHAATTSDMSALELPRAPSTLRLPAPWVTGGWGDEGPRALQI